MTVTSTYSPVQYIGNGTTTAFAFPYLFYNNSEITCSVYDSSTGATTPWVLGTNFSLTGAGVSSGGTVTALLGAPTSTQTLTIQRIVAFTQGTHYTAYGLLPPASVEQNLDELTFQTQQLNVTQSRSLQIPVTDSTGLTVTLPNAATRANNTLIFDSNGNVTVGSTATGAIVSAAMLPVVEASTLAIGRTAFGLGSAAVLPSTAFLNVSLNLSDVAATSTALVNLGLANSAGTILTPSSTTVRASLSVPPGTAPTSPNNGDIWTTSAGIYVRVNSVTVGPLTAGSTSAFATLMTPFVTTLTGAGQTGNTTHGLGGVPTYARLMLRCLTADGGYSNGDETEPGLDMSSSGYGASYWTNSTQVGFATGGSGVRIFNKSTGVIFTITTYSNWALVIYAAR